MTGASNGLFVSAIYKWHSFAMPWTSNQSLLLSVATSTSASLPWDMKRFRLRLQTSDKMHCSSHIKHRLEICTFPHCKSFWPDNLEKIYELVR